MSYSDMLVTFSILVSLVLVHVVPGRELDNSEDQNRDTSN